MIVTEMNEGKKIAYAVNGTTLDFADGALTLNLQRSQRDYEIIRDIMANGDGNLMLDGGRYYVAQVVIPPIEYEEVEKEASEDEEDGEQMPATERRAKPLDMDKVELRLFSIDGIYIG